MSGPSGDLPPLEMATAIGPSLLVAWFSTVYHALATKAAGAAVENYDVILPFLRRPSTHRKVEQLIRQGVGVREASWHLPSSAQGSPAAHALASTKAVESIVVWVRKAMTEMRRPYGIDHVALALACRDASGKVLCSNALGVVRPGSFYAPEGATRVEAFLRDVEQVRDQAGVEVVAALLSLGDLAFELGVSRAA